MSKVKHFLMATLLLVPSILVLALISRSVLPANFQRFFSFSA